MPARRFAVIRELTKIHEEVVRGVLEPTRSFAEFDAARGEIVIVIEAAAEALPTVEEAEEVVRRLVGEGLSARDAAREAASVTGRPRSELYKIAIELGSKRG
jgi:16S rRNA (cytidine1402-2'-O)-methyltransferase